MNLTKIFICGNRRCTNAVDDPGVDSQAEVKAVDEQPKDNVVHVDGSRKAEGLSH